MSLSIDVVSDVVCPWCFIGKRRLEGALALYAKERPDAPAPTVTWRPFQLNPGLPAEGMARADYVAQKFGPRGGAVYTRVAAVGREVGIDFAFDRITRQPNTLAAHSLIELAGAGPPGRHEGSVLPRLPRRRRPDLAREPDRDRDSAGLDRATVEAWLDNATRRREAVATEDARARARHRGRRLFIFNGRLGVSGAQGSEVLLDAMKQAESAA
jgi:predicted DsbA family dithiol-disulfide isomerase